MAATLGVQVDKEIKYLELTDMTLGRYGGWLPQPLRWRSCAIGWRSLSTGRLNVTVYSPPGGSALAMETFPSAYSGNLPGRWTPPKPSGLTVNGSGILLPRKSVTAILGLSSEPIAAAGRSCTSCPNWESCPYRKGGTFCEPDKTTV